VEPFDDEDPDDEDPEDEDADPDDDEDEDDESAEEVEVLSDFFSDERPSPDPFVPSEPFEALPALAAARLSVR
jgi:hypothetical protein